MLNTLQYIILTVTNTTTYVPPEEVCKKDESHLTTSNRITFEIGCSEVNGKRVYPDYVLEGLYNGKSFTY